jgi:hypothetical protein
MAAFAVLLDSWTGQALSLPYSQHIAKKAGQARPVQSGLWFYNKCTVKVPVFHRIEEFPGYILAGLDRPMCISNYYFVGTGLDLSLVSETRRYARLYRNSGGWELRRAVKRVFTKRARETINFSRI